MRLSKPRTALTITLSDDEEIPHSSTEKLLARFNPGIARMTLIEGVGHNDFGKNPEYRATLQAALRYEAKPT